MTTPNTPGTSNAIFEGHQAEAGQVHNSAALLEVLSLIKNTNESIYVTGPAGSGKSTLIRRIRAEVNKNIIVLAPTGIAAVNAAGETIHSFCRFPFRVLMPEDEGIKEMPEQQKELFRKVETIIVDEISMVRADILDGIDTFFRKNTGNSMPFGGKQVVLIGDPYQIEPIPDKDPLMRKVFDEIYTSPFFFSAMVFKKLAPRKIELNVVYRQRDTRFVDMLNRIRVGTYDASDIVALNRACFQNTAVTQGVGITLCATNKAAESINSAHMSRLSGTSRKYEGSVEGVFPNDKMVAPKELELKCGAQVVMLANDSLRQYVNGTLGVVEELKSDSIRVKLEDGTVVEVGKKTWENHRYTVDRKTRRVSSEVVGYYVQFPVKAAWAITIHKSQGLTFNRVSVDLGFSGAFANGQTYVALSRCRSMQGLSFKQALKPKDILVSVDVSRFETGKAGPKPGSLEYYLEEIARSQRR